MENTFEKPDFAFPVTVEQNALPVMNASLVRADYGKALLAAIQLDVADSQRDKQSCRASLARFDSLARVMPAPWNSLALLLEAQLFSDIYTSDSWTYSNRRIAPTPIPENIYEWSGEMFKTKVKELVGRSLKGSDMDSQLPLSAVQIVLTNYENAEKTGFSVADFIDMKAIDILNVFDRESSGAIIPFGEAVSSGNGADSNPSVAAILDRVIKRHQPDEDKYLLSYFYKLKLSATPYYARRNMLDKCRDIFTDTPYYVPFIIEYCGLPKPEGMEENDWRRSKLRVIDDYISRFPQAPAINDLKNLRSELVGPQMALNFDEHVLSGVNFDVSVNAENMYDSYLIVLSLPDYNRSYTYGDLPGLKVVNAVPVRLRGSIPDIVKDRITVPALAPGRYAIVLSSSSQVGGIYEKDPKYILPALLVSDLAAFYLKENNETGRLYVTSGKNQKPIEGAEVKLYENPRTNRRLVASFRTDKEGKIAFKPGHYEYVISYEGSRLQGEIYQGRESVDNKPVTRAQILTDLSVYRPGAELRGATILYSESDHQLSAVASKKLRLILRDANYQQVDTVSVCTDEFGRAPFSFSIPAKGLLGSWSVGVEMDGDRLSNTSVEVAEYKMPTFLVDLKADGESFSPGDIVKFSGRALTYSGMPVAGAKVSFKIEAIPSWWRRWDVNGSYGGETMTSDDGTFEISLPTRAIENTPFSRASYRISVDVTDGAGETQSSIPLIFSLGNGMNIQASIPKMINAEENTELHVKVLNLANNELRKTLYYKISSDGMVRKDGKFLSPHFKPDFRGLPSGKYEIIFSLDPEFRETDEYRNRCDSVILWRPNDKQPPVQSVIWTPRSEIEVPAGVSNVPVKVGSTYRDGYVLAVVSNSKGYVKSEWLKVSEGFVSVEVPAPLANERAFVKFKGLRNLDNEELKVTLVPLGQKKKLSVKAESFRDFLRPGSQEEWKFKFSIADENLNVIPAMAVMTDKALNTIRQFSWSFNPSGSLYWNNPTSINWDYRGLEYLNYRPNIKYLPSNALAFQKPVWQTYGYPLYYDARVREMTTRMYKARALSTTDTGANDSIDGTVVMEEPQLMMNSAMAGGALLTMGSEDAVAESSMEQGSGDTESSSREALREVTMPIAFFMPSLISDSEGNLTVEFTAPDFVGTWQFQLLGYTPDMKGIVFSHDAVSSKPVMVKLNAPRFVRCGDIMSVSATVFNNTDTALNVKATITLINPVDNSVISESGEGLDSLLSNSSRVVTARMHVPDEVDSMIIRVIAETAEFSDGEQTSVPVLPGSTLVRESTPFYISQEKKEFSTVLPEFEKDAQVTFTYCDNPVWECVTALPAITVPESVSILAQSSALFGNAVASGLFKKYPELIRCIESLASSGDPALSSPLAKNADMKNTELINTPWVNNAASESERMMSLVKYADKSLAEESVKDNMNIIKTRQNADGGWSWCPDMKSSTYMTGRVVNLFASLKNLGFIPDGADAMVRKACMYLDKVYAEEWNRGHRKYYPREELLNYLWAKSRFGNLKSNSGFRELDAVVIRDIKNEWKKFSVAGKATAAMLLASRNEMPLARMILESLRQMASENEQKGMWFANLESDWCALPVLQTTARVLEAFAQIEPSDPAIDKIRQWIVLSKQTQDWKGSGTAVEAVTAILSSGTDWISDSGSPEIKIGNDLMELPAGNSGVGSFVIDLDPRVVAGKSLSVSRTSNSPAWGGVLAQYQAPIRDVKPHAVPQLSIRKNVYVVSEQGTCTQVSEGNLKVGDHVRVTFTIVTERTLDYIAITDPRASCLEPVVQLSGYSFSDGIGMYREVRDESTNLFISSLQKGTHVISYECYVDRVGEYSLGIAIAQSQYAPLIVASTAGQMMVVK